MFSISVLIFTSFVLSLVHSSDEGGGNVLCSVQEYVKVGLEFEQCQKTALFNYSKGLDPCPMLKKVVDTCAYNVKECFTDKGFKRGQQIFFDQLAIQYPEVNSCEAFADKESLNEKDGDQRCSVAEEVVNGQDVARCINSMQTEMVHQFMTLKEKEDVKVRYNHFCDSLLKVKEACIDVKLQDCYIGHDFDAHSAYLLEALKISGDVIAIHLGNVTDVPSCPVFHLDGSMSLLPLADDSNSVNIVMAVILSLIVTGLIIAALAFVAVKLRLVPRAKAWVANTPYTHELETGGRNNVEIVPASISA